MLKPSPPEKLGSTKPLRKGERTKLQVLEAALKIISEKGFEGFTLLDVANVVGITRGNVLRLFDTREQLIEESTYYMGEKAREFREVYLTKTATEKSPLDYARSMFAWSNEHPTHLNYLMALLNRASYDKATRRRLDGLFEGGRQRIHALLIDQKLSVATENTNILSKLSNEDLQRLSFEIHSTLLGFFVLLPIASLSERPDLESKCLRTIESHLKTNGFR